MEAADCEFDQPVAQITSITPDECIIAVGYPCYFKYIIQIDRNRRCPGDVSLGIKTGVFDHAAKEGIERRPF